MDKLLLELQDYLRDVLGISVFPERWRASGNLPIYLGEAYAFYQISLLGSPCLLMIARDTREIVPEVIRKQMLQAHKSWNGEILLVTSALSRYARKAMIEYKVPFIVPGSQLYLPPLGIDLREHFRSIRPTTHLFSPSTQAVVLYGICYGPHASYIPTELAAKLGYSPMTMSRAFDELEAAELAEVGRHGKKRILKFIGNKATIWQKAQEMMRDPVRKRVLCRQPVEGWPVVQAGLTALAHYTMLIAPDRPVYAMSSAEWRRFDTGKQVHDRMQADCELELWSYSPGLFANARVADPFSLYLSLKHFSDERVESALAQMMEQALW